MLRGVYIVDVYDRAHGRDDGVRTAGKGLVFLTFCLETLGSAI